MSEMHIRVLHTPECAGTPRAIEEASAVVDELGIAAEISDVLIESAEEAQELGFRGSPTMTIDGIDVEEGPQSPVGSFG